MMGDDDNTEITYFTKIIAVSCWIFKFYLDIGSKLYFRAVQ